MKVLSTSCMWKDDEVERLTSRKISLPPVIEVMLSHFLLLIRLANLINAITSDYDPFRLKLQSLVNIFRWARLCAVLTAAGGLGRV